MPLALVVDDSAAERRMIGCILAESNGLRITYAQDGHEALEQIALELPDIIVTDLVMPGMDGLELVIQVTKDYPSLPVLLLSGQGNEKIAVQALRLGAATYVPKNSLASHLMETVESILAMTQHHPPAARAVAHAGDGEIVFSIGNDAELIPSIVNYVQNVVTAVGLCDDSDVIRVCIAMEEAVRNAMFHGNLEISSEVREGDSQVYADLLTHRTEHHPWAQRKLRIGLHVSPHEGRFTVRDEGPGFDPTRLADPTDPANIEKVSGRGLLLIRTFMDEVHFNPTGNEVTMIKRRAKPLVSSEEVTL